MSAELRALCVLDSAGVAVSVSQCMDCARPYAARMVAGFGDGARVALSHGICDDCNEDRAFAEIDKQKARKAYDAATWINPATEAK